MEKRIGFETFCHEIIKCISMKKHDEVIQVTAIVNENVKPQRYAFYCS